VESIDSACVDELMDEIVTVIDASICANFDSKRDLDTDPGGRIIDIFNPNGIAATVPSLNVI